MKYCTKCGAEIFDDAVICIKCGCAVEGGISEQPIQKAVQNSTDEKKAGNTLLPVFNFVFSIASIFSVFFLITSVLESHISIYGSYYRYGNWYLEDDLLRFAIVFSGIATVFALTCLIIAAVKKPTKEIVFSCISRLFFAFLLFIACLIGI
ncbi:MAG: hypothetical protein IJW16_06700 [Clostridia bacterium]|nr:hypothetical protein [Clostridia bacterium]